MKDFKEFLIETEETLAKVWFEYKQGKGINSGQKLLNYLNLHPEEAKLIAEKSKEIVKHYKKLYRVGDDTGLSWTTNKKILQKYFPEEYADGVYELDITPEVLDRIIEHEDVFPMNHYTKHAPEQEVILKP